MTEFADRLTYIPKYLKVIDKDSNLVPMILYPCQVHYIKNRGNRNIVLKARQLGISTGIEADNSVDIFTLPFQRMAIVTHDTETSEFLLQNIHRFHRHLPKDEQPEVDWSSASHIRFPIIDNYIYIDSAKSDSIGVGHTLNIVHLSEVARWYDKKARILFAEISQTVPLNGRITVESTPRGRAGLFYELYQSAKKNEIPYKTFFYAWWWDLKYRLPIEGKFEPTKEEKPLMEIYHLVPEQIAFRRLKQAELGDLFYQEYPENDLDCWLSSEIAILDPTIIRSYYPRIQEGKQEGNLTIWKDVVGGRKYTIGVDTAAGYERGDYSVACVVDIRNLEYVARLRGHIPPDLFAEQVYNLGKRYNMAEIGVERQAHGHTVLRILLEKDYPNIYYHLDYDDIKKSNTSEPGWKTSMKTKPTMVTDLVAAMRANDLISYSQNLLDEGSALSWEGQQKVYCPPSAYDDEWDALSIALQLREQTPIIEDIKAPHVFSYAKTIF